MINQILSQVYEHAVMEAPRECCGLVQVIKGKYVYKPCGNLSNEDNNFIMNPYDYADAEDAGEIVYIVHSHPKSLPNPSHTDLVNLEKDNIPWLIVNPFSKSYTITEPTGFKLPLIGREFHHGVIDCYSLIKDYYADLNIILPEPVRPDLWWELGQNLYDENFDKAGFKLVTDGSIQLHDVLLMRVGSSVNNHGAVYVGDNKILHHPMKRLSTTDIYGGWWQKITNKVIRHSSLI